ncbi:hypothetical protein KC19_1G260700 [Ceratodon purpureus]|uniref:Uncharacterized protein n=1 Tax=Ceratodon purpureus TaxID=3225 RepID=A0A8T0JAJ5_CERPU|nr:hypothetical protein KC19_1G260700 [Ceratodon purpureus]
MCSGPTFLEVGDHHLETVLRPFESFTCKTKHGLAPSRQITEISNTRLLHHTKEDQRQYWASALTVELHAASHLPHSFDDQGRRILRPDRSGPVLLTLAFFSSTDYAPSRFLETI